MNLHVKRQQVSKQQTRRMGKDFSELHHERGDIACWPAREIQSEAATYSLRSECNLQFPLRIWTSQAWRFPLMWVMFIIVTFCRHFVTTYLHNTLEDLEMWNNQQKICCCLRCFILRLILNRQIEVCKFIGSSKGQAMNAPGPEGQGLSGSVFCGWWRVPKKLKRWKVMEDINNFYTAGPSSCSFWHWVHEKISHCWRVIGFIIMKKKDLHLFVTTHSINLN